MGRCPWVGAEPLERPAVQHVGSGLAANPIVMMQGIDQASREGERDDAAGTIAAQEFHPRSFHRLANIFPLIEGAEFDELVASVSANGLRDPIILHEGMILDGRHRYRACVAAGVVPRFELLQEGSNALQYVIDRNLRRRHLNDNQRASVAAKIANLSRGRPPEENGPIGLINIGKSAKLMNVAPRQVRRARAVHERGVSELADALDRGEIAVSAAEKIARLPQEQQPKETARALPNGTRAIIASRQEPKDSLDYFPTPPWATRVLIERIFPRLGRPAMRIAWEPACGEGHMAEVLAEYFSDVQATDIFDYGYGDVPIDFLTEDAGVAPDWIITNPPFGEKSEQFVLRALDLANVGVAMFVRLQWLETNGRYERIFRDRPPTLIAFFAERVNLCKGRWEPDGSTATAYIWLIWVKGMAPRAPFWIPPGQREALTRPDDADRFTAHPVIRTARLPAPNNVSEIAVPIDDNLNGIPLFLQRGHPVSIFKAST